MPTIEKVTEGCLVGEGPHWDVATQGLYFVDVFGKSSILRYIPATKKLTRAYFEKPVHHIIPIEGKNNEFLVAQHDELLLISWDGESDKTSIIQKLCSVDPPKTFNDAKCDSLGRLWTGAHVMSEDFTKMQPLGTIYSLDSNLQFKGHVEKIRCSNGLTFDDKKKKMYYIDSLDRTVDRFDFDVDQGTISNRQTWFSLEKFDIPGYTDGMTIDSDGNLWVAIFGGSRVLKISGDRKETLLDTVNIPTEQVASVTFGGQNLDELYVTTGAVDLAEMKPLPVGKGETYKVTGLGVKGLPAYNFKLN